MLKKVLLWLPCALFAGSIGFVEDQQPPTEEERLEQERQIQQQLSRVDALSDSQQKKYDDHIYNQEKDFRKKTLVKKGRSYIDLFYNKKATLTVTNPTFKYVPVAKESMTAQSTNVTAIDADGAAFYTSFVSRQKHFAYGLQVDYINHPTISLGPGWVTMAMPAGANDPVPNPTDGTTSVPPEVITPPTTTMGYASGMVKTTSFPVHASVYFFPFYDIRVQPYLKVGIGANFISGKMLLTPSTAATTMPTGAANPINPISAVDQTGYTMIPFTFSYGAGVQVHLLPEWSVTLSYNALKLSRGRGPKESMTDANTGQQYGQMRLYYDNSFKSTMNIGMCYYF